MNMELAKLREEERNWIERINNCIPNERMEKYT
jgi:hypothetical protein